jgi:antitoxin component of RelBE/YafQ-DinJ toxin-antitoxin module
MMSAGRVVPLSVVLDVWALGTLVSHYYGPGTGYVSLQVVVIRIPAIQPQPLEAVIDCLIRMMLNAVVENVNLPFHVLIFPKTSADAFAALRALMKSSDCPLGPTQEVPKALIDRFTIERFSAATIGALCPFPLLLIGDPTLNPHIAPRPYLVAK